MRCARDRKSNRSRTKRRGSAIISQYGVGGVGRGWGYFPTPYLPQFFTESGEIKCIREAISGRNDPAPCAGGARTLPGRMQGSLPTLYPPHFFTKSRQITCVGHVLCGRTTSAPSAGGAETFPNIVQPKERWHAGVPTLPVAPSFPHGFL